MMFASKRRSVSSLNQRLREILMNRLSRFVCHHSLYMYILLHMHARCCFQVCDTENVDPELRPADETRSNKRHHDDVTSPPDVEDIGSHQNKRPPSSQTPAVTKHTTLKSSWLGNQGRQSWREVLGPPPSRGSTRVC